MSVSLSFIIPVLNEEQAIGPALQRLRRQFPDAQLVVVDGGSDDRTCANARGQCDALLSSAPGRARQMNAGAAVARGDYLLFLHVDTELLGDPAALLAELESRPDWGFCRVRLSGAPRLLRLVEGGMNWRSRLTRVATGDQMLWLRRELFTALGGYDDIPLMEDVALSKRLRTMARPSIVSPGVLTSSRRWEQRGIVRTVLQMWTLRLAWFVGVSPQRLWRYYYG